MLSDHAIACQDDIILCCGGSQEGKSSLILKKDVYMYDAWYNQWKTVAPMNEERAMAACGTYQGLYFVVGGYTIFVGTDQFLINFNGRVAFVFRGLCVCVCVCGGGGGGSTETNRTMKN